MVDQNEIVKPVEEITRRETPKEELQAVKEIYEFMEQLADDKGEAFEPRKSQHTVAELVELKTTSLEQELGRLPPKEKLALEFKIKREAEYEAFKGEIDFRNDQLKRLTEYIETKDIWKTKFSTSQSVRADQFNNLSFAGDGSESRNYDQQNSFAGQSRDSIYFVSKSGLSLRLKVDELFGKDGFRAVLRSPKELIIFLNRKEKDKRHLEILGGNDFQDYPEEIISFTPQLGYNVEEFRSSNFGEDSSSNFKSQIEVKKQAGRLTVKNYDTDHSGHQVNRIFY